MCMLLIARRTDGVQSGANLMLGLEILALPAVSSSRRPTLPVDGGIASFCARADDVQHYAA